MKKVPFLLIGILALLILSLFFLWSGNVNSMQSASPLIAGIGFRGEYSIDGGEWHEVTEGEHISSTRGEVRLRGYFDMLDPLTGENVGLIQPGTTVSLYLNHLRASVLMPSGRVMSFDVENEILGEDACATMWSAFTLYEEDGVEEGAPIIITLNNPHCFGNERAIDEMIENLSLAPSIYLETMMLEKGEAERNIGTLILIASLIILGIATFSSFIHLKYTREMWLIGAMSVAAGGYFFFNSFSLCLHNHSNIVNTRALGLCIMLYALFVTLLVGTILKGRAVRIARTLGFLTGAAIALCITLSLFEEVYFFDTWLYFSVFECIAATVLIICLARNFLAADIRLKILYITGVLPLLSFVLDFCATCFGVWEGGIVSKHVFLAIFMMALVVVLRIIPSHINAAMRAAELEAEQQSLQLELQESRISIMLSQMQPHFIFNTLNTIYHLCQINPDKARHTISSFSEYLRNNIDTLGQSEMISFEKELSFVKTYLDIEKVRFDDELEIIFDIELTDFKLPVLTVQPIVENAVKHGTSKKEGVSTLTLKTREMEDCYEITITDTGVGFKADEYKNDGHKHVGISSVEERLKNLCNGTLRIDSKLGEGTTAVIVIPKKEREK